MFKLSLWIILLIYCLFVNNVFTTDFTEKVNQFNEYYKSYKKLHFSTKSSTPLNQYYFKIIWMGPSILPILFDRLEKGDSGVLPFISSISSVIFDGEFDYNLSQERIAFLQWWKTDRKKIKQRYKELSEGLVSLPKVDREKKISFRNSQRNMNEVFKMKIIALGLDVIPLLFNDVRQGKVFARDILEEIIGKKLLKSIEGSNKRDNEKIYLWWLNNRRKFTIEDEKILEIKNSTSNNNPIRLAQKWIELLSSGHELYYQNAEIGLEDLPETQEINEILIDAMKSGKSAQVRKSIALTLGIRKYKNDNHRKKSKKALLEQSRDPDGHVRSEVIFALGEMGDKGIIPILKKMYVSDTFCEEVDSFDGKEYKKKKIFPVKREIKRLFERWGEKVPE